MGGCDYRFKVLKLDYLMANGVMWYIFKVIKLAHLLLNLILRLLTIY